MLNNVSFWLWDNRAANEGLKIWATLNYNQPNEKSISAQMKGAQTYRTWTGYNRNQPESLTDFFSKFKHTHKPYVKDAGYDWWVSKFGYNDGSNGPVVMPAAALVFEENGVYGFSIQLQDRHFAGDFDPDNISNRQRTPNRDGKFCIGMYRWQQQPPAKAGTLW
jgi:hypothetical protein